jgi:hypothetical protein
MPDTVLPGTECYQNIRMVVYQAQYQPWPQVGDTPGNSGEITSHNDN